MAHEAEAQTQAEQATEAASERYAPAAEDVATGGEKAAARQKARQRQQRGAEQQKTTGQQKTTTRQKARSKPAPPDDAVAGGRAPLDATPSPDDRPVSVIASDEVIVVRLEPGATLTDPRNDIAIEIDGEQLTVEQRAGWTIDGPSDSGTLVLTPPRGTRVSDFGAERRSP